MPIEHRDGNMNVVPYTDAMVCTDCYTAHHYGTFRVAVFADGTSILWDDETNVPDGATLHWYAGDSDTPCEAGQPLSEIADAVHVTDNTDSETGEGITEFSWSRCGGCGSTLGGSRYRVAIWQ